MHVDGVIYAAARVCQREIWGSGSMVGREEKPARVTASIHGAHRSMIEFASHHRIENLSARYGLHLKKKTRTITVTVKIGSVSLKLFCSESRPAASTTDGDHDDARDHTPAQTRKASSDDSDSWQ
jgi:hypothetical protein